MTTPAPAPAPTRPVVGVNVARALISVLETAGFIIASVLYALNNGSDSHNAVLTALVAAIMHGANHNAGGSPV